MQISSVIDKQFIGVHELRRNLTKLLTSLKTGEDSVVITHQGKPAAVLTSVETHTQMLEMIDELQLAIRELANKDYIRELIRQEAKVRKGKGTPSEKLYKSLGI